MVKRDLITQILLIVLALLVAVALRLFVFEPHTVASSQANAFISSQDYLLVTKLSLPKHKDLVLYEVDGKRYVGRVIATSGDTVVYMDDILYLNHHAEQEAYLYELRQAFFKSQPSETAFTADFTSETLAQTEMGYLPEHHFLILNDDRQNQQDSRTFGLISRSQIVGVLSFRLLPLDKFGFLDVE
ncbi:signal peptidase I [Streptococcus plurextorum]|uniref:signal peptidase I n=1 Tax=Streptococcus plurextorum TaxID=456876 RepID=UPI00041A84BE|nr:signal peptidase I [Streptococcus plurextorum]